MPTLLDHRGQPLKREPCQNSVLARFDLAQTTVHNKKHWANADSLAARAAMNPAVRTLCRNRSRYECENNPWYKGMVRTAANHIVGGRGPVPQVRTPNTEGNIRLERGWRQWSRRTRFASKLRRAVQTYWGDGEVFAMRKSRPRNWPVTLDVVLFEAEYCSDPLSQSFQASSFVDDGIRLGPDGVELEYWFWDHHPGDTAWSANLKGRWYQADEVIHLYREERPGQSRGIPRCTSSLPMLPIMRRQEMATLLASETAASFATYLKSNTNALPPSASPQDFAEIEIAWNMLTTLPAGWDIEQMEGKHPGPQYEMFQRQALTAFARCTNMPYALAAGTSRDSNFSSLKGDIRNVWEPEVRTEQDDIETAVLNVVWGWFLEDAMYAGMLDGMPPASEIDITWQWEPLPELDEYDAAQAAALRLSTGQSMPSSETPRRGTDFEADIEQGARDYGVTTDQMRKALFDLRFKPAPALFGDSPAETASPAGEFKETGQRAWRNNQNRINHILQQVREGEITESRARLDLQSIGLTRATADDYLSAMAEEVPSVATT